MRNIQFVKGDCLMSNSFKSYLEDVDGVIHCVGTLFEKRNDPTSSYIAMNRDTCVNMASELESIAEKKKEKRQFVMISSEKAPAFLENYVTTKREAERFLLEECAHLVPTIIRPGFIADKDHRWWSQPVRQVNDCLWALNENIAKKMPFGDKVDFLFPAKSTQLSTVAHFAIEGVQGKLTEKVITNDIMILYES